MILYSYFRSSASYRVRLAFALKGLAPDEIRFVNLREDEQSGGTYAAINPQHLLPSLVLESGTVLTQSLAIMEYLDETFPAAPRLLPTDVAGKARVRALAHSIACDIQPLVNLRVLRRVQEMTDEAGKDRWLQHWLETGLRALETTLARDAETGIFCHGDAPGMADCCLLPQVFSAQRFAHDLTPYPTVRRILAALTALPLLAAAHPSAQADNL